MNYNKAIEIKNTQIEELKQEDIELKNSIDEYNKKKYKEILTVFFKKRR